MVCTFVDHILDFDNFPIVYHMVNSDYIVDFEDIVDIVGIDSADIDSVDIDFVGIDFVDIGFVDIDFVDIDFVDIGSVDIDSLDIDFVDIGSVDIEDIADFVADYIYFIVIIIYAKKKIIL